LPPRRRADLWPVVFDLGCTPKVLHELLHDLPPLLLELTLTLRCALRLPGFAVGADAPVGPHHKYRLVRPHGRADGSDG
jgi:hypothetical protein